ncbi:hypothetical protein TNCV_1068971 [Trichonephila clavipes]|nr:hypothetical protein TNCV_1068971 [Trichonephila clavipes]
MQSKENPPKRKFADSKIHCIETGHSKKDSETGKKCIPFEEIPVKVANASSMDLSMFEILKRTFGNRHPRTVYELRKTVQDEWRGVWTSRSERCHLHKNQAQAPSTDQSSRKPQPRKKCTRTANCFINRHPDTGNTLIRGPCVFWNHKKSLG